MCITRDGVSPPCPWQRVACLEDSFAGWEKPGIPLCVITDKESRLNELLDLSYKAALETVKGAVPRAPPRANGPPHAGEQPQRAHFAPFPCSEMHCV
jgi:hypothetical protein